MAHKPVLSIETLFAGGDNWVKLQSCNPITAFANCEETMKLMKVPPSKVTAFKSQLEKAINNSPKIKSHTPEEANFRLGIEVEAENMRIFQEGQNFAPTYFWQVKPEGSLRNFGAEFVSWPTKSEDISLIVNLLFEYMKVFGAEPVFSWRSSIHTHINCRSLPIECFKNLVLLSLVCEDALFAFASPSRRDVNIFCTPLTRVNFYALSSFMSTPNDNKVAVKAALKSVINSVKKYSAVNFSRLPDLGTLEFRHLRGTNDPSIIIRWCQLIEALFAAAYNYPSERLYQAIKDLNTSSAYNQFLEMIFGESLANLVFSPSYAVRLSRNISIAKEILSAKEFTESIKISPNSGIYSFIQTEARKDKKDKLASRKSKATI